MRTIVLSVRGMPAGWLGAYGNEWVATPNLDRFAAEGIVFDQHISDCPNSAAAEKAWLAGGQLLHELRDANVRTVLVRAEQTEPDSSFFYAGWSEVFDARPQEAEASPLDNLIRQLPSVLDKLGAVPRWLLWIDVDRLIPPWNVPHDVFEAYITDEDEPPTENEERVEPLSDPVEGPFDKSDLAAWQWLHSSFAAVVTTLDAELGAIFEEMRTRGLDQTASWLLTSDLGYPLGEHGQVGVHRPWLHEELVHLPLVLRLPGAAENGRRVAALTQPPNLAPTLRELYGLEKVAGTLLPLARGEVASLHNHAVTKLENQGRSEVAIRTPEWALLLPKVVTEGDPPRSSMLFVKPDDRWEVNDVTGQHAEVVEMLSARID